MVTVGRNWLSSHLLSACLEAVIVLYSTGVCGGMGAALYMLFLIVCSFPGSKRLGAFWFLVFGWSNSLLAPFADSQEKRIFPL